MSLSFLGGRLSPRSSSAPVVALQVLTVDEAESISGGNYNRAGDYAGHPAQPGFKNPTVYSDDGINIRTSDPSTTNVGYDSPFTPIPFPA